MSAPRTSTTRMARPRAARAEIGCMRRARHTVATLQ